VKLNYLKIAEVQRRGLIHVHAVFRLDGPNGPDSPPPPWIKIDQVKLSIARVIRETKVTDVDGVPLAWGSQFDIQDLVTSSESGRKVTAYLAKYTTKTTDDSTNFARRFNSRQQIEYLRGNSHLQRMALTAWDLESELTLRSLKLREHANTLGFRSQLITKSRSFSTTFTQLRRARTDFRSQQTSIDPVKASFLYDGRGYDDPSASRLAEVMFKMSKELREELSRKQRAELRSTQVID
jgi:hypothetical protein